MPKRRLFYCYLPSPINQGKFFKAYPLSTSSSSDPDSLSVWVNVIYLTTILILSAFTLTAYENNLTQLGLFGVIYITFTFAGWGVWGFKTYLFNDNDEPSAGKFIYTGAVITGGLFGATVIISALSKLKFLSVMQFDILKLGYGFLAPLSTVANNTNSTILTFLMNIPAPVAEEAIFRVAICTVFLAALGKYGIEGKITVVIISAVSFGCFHWYSYGADLWQIAAAIAAGAILATYYCFIQKSMLVVTAGHFIYNFIVLIVSLLPSFILTAVANSPLAIPIQTLLIVAPLAATWVSMRLITTRITTFSLTKLLELQNPKIFKGEIIYFFRPKWCMN